MRGLENSYLGDLKKIGTTLYTHKVRWNTAILRFLRLVSNIL
jgi:hypothetical protein